MRDTYDIMEYVTDLLHDTSANMWSNLKKLRAINASYDQICNRVIELHENWFYKTATLTPGTASWEATPFNFPSAPATISKILLLTDGDGVPINPINVAQRDLSFPSIISKNVRVGYWLDQDKIWLNADAYADNIRLYYIRKPARLQYGTAEAGDGTTMTLDADTRPEVVDDYYNNVAFMIREGSGIGEEATATDYVGSTRVLTANFASTPTTNSVYGSVSELPDGHNEIVAVGAAIRAILFDVAQVEKLNALRTHYQKLEYDLIDFLQKRQVQSSRGVYMSNLD